MAKVNLLSQKQYAKHRGCSAAAVCKAIKEERISLVNGQIDPVVADIQWEANSRARVPNVNNSAPPAAAVAPAAGAASSVETGAASLDLVDAAQANDAASPEAPGGDALAGDPRYQDSRASREEAVARREWIRLLEDEGKLVRIDQVQAELAARLAPVREAFLQFAPRIAPILAAEGDAAKIQTLIETEIHQILAQLRESPVTA